MCWLLSSSERTIVGGFWSSLIYSFSDRQQEHSWPKWPETLMGCPVQDFFGWPVTNQPKVILFTTPCLTCFFAILGAPIARSKSIIKFTFKHFTENFKSSVLNNKTDTAVWGKNCFLTISSGPCGEYKAIFEITSIMTWQELGIAKIKSFLVQKRKKRMAFWCKCGRPALSLNTVKITDQLIFSYL